MEFPQRFGKFELLERLAIGGMAEIFLARVRGVAGFEKRLVIKRILPELAGDPRFVGMFIQEARIGVHLDHPNVVQVHELGRVGNGLFIAMEYLHGRDLTRWIKALRADGRRLPVHVAVAIAADVCRGLAYAHARADAMGRPLGLVHRDVSPHNVLVTFTGDVKLVDFGIARAMHSATAPVTPGGGKFAYMSPEQANGEPVGAASDIYGAGILTWELLVGQRLFTHPDPAEKLRRVREAIIDPPSVRGVTVDPTLERIVGRARARDPADRHPTAADLEEDLRAWLFERRERVDRDRIAAELRLAFPDEPPDRGGTYVLDQVASDLDRLGDATPHTPDVGRLVPPRSERRLVGVIFIDVDGITELSERLEPEQMFRRHLHLLRWVRRIADPFGALLARAIDDHITLLFGVRRATGNEIDRALDCALALRDAIGQLRAQGLPVQFAMGVHYGEVSTTQVGRRVRYMARGDATRLARRLSASADGGEVLVSQRAFTALEGAYDFRRAEVLPGRQGRPDSPSYRLLGRNLSAPNRRAWVRRGPELDAVRDLLATLGEGRGAAIAFSGPTGSGRSRLVGELAHLAERRGLAALVVRVSGWGEPRPWPVFADMVRTWAPATGPDGDGVMEALATYSTPVRDAEVLASLAGRPTRHRPEPGEIAAAIAAWLTRRAADAPFLIVVDDLHHLGVADRDALVSVVRATRPAPIGWLATSRTPVDAPFQDVGLPALSDAAEARLVATTLDVTSVDPQLLATIRRQSEGNPRYVEEILKFLLARGLVETVDGVAKAKAQSSALPLPNTLAGLVAARLDDLDPAHKGLLQLAAVGGDTFDQDLLAEASGYEETAVALVALSGRGLVRRDGEAGRWRFVSDVVREVARRSTLLGQRTDYHRWWAAALERRAVDDPGLWPALSEHHGRSGRRVDAARWRLRAGERDERAQHLAAAAAHYEAGLRWLQNERGTVDREGSLQGQAILHLRLGSVACLLGNVTKGERNLQVALGLGADEGLPWVEVPSHLALARSLAQRGRTPQAQAHVEGARAALALHPDAALEAEAAEVAAGIAFDLGRTDEAEALWHVALQAAGDDATAVARCEVGLAARLLRTGQLEEARPRLVRALEAARLAGDRILEGRVLNNLGLLHAELGDRDAALAHFRRAMEVREGIGYQRGVIVNLHNIGDTHFRAGQFHRAAVAFERSRELAQAMGWEQGMALNDVFLAHLRARTGEVDDSVIAEATARAAALGTGDAAVVGEWLGNRAPGPAPSIDDAVPEPRGAR